MGHIAGWTQVYRRGQDHKLYLEQAPVYVMDLTLQIVPPVGGEIVLGELRHLIYDLSANGYTIACVSMDSWQSADAIQQLQQRGYNAMVISVDVTTVPYETLKTAIYETRFFTYPYPQLDKELRQLEDDKRGTHRKIDHPLRGSKDVSDSVAGVVYTLAQFGTRETLPMLTGEGTYQTAVIEPNYLGHRSAGQPTQSGSPSSVSGPAPTAPSLDEVKRQQDMLTPSDDLLPFLYGAEGVVQHSAAIHVDEFDWDGGSSIDLYTRRR